MDLRIQPVQSESIPTSGAVVPVPSRSPATVGAGPTAPDLLDVALGLQAHLAKQIVELGADPAVKEAYLERLRAEGEAERIVRKALREEAAIEARIRQKEREEASIEPTVEGRIRLAYSASELREILQSAERLNIQA